MELEEVLAKCSKPVTPEGIFFFIIIIKKSEVGRVISVAIFLTIKIFVLLKNDSMHGDSKDDSTIFLPHIRVDF